LALAHSDAWTNFKVEGGGTSLKQKWGHPAQSPRKKFFGRAPPLFVSKSTISRFGKRFRDGQYSLVSFLFAVLLLTVPPCPVICKTGGTCLPSALWSRRHGMHRLCPSYSHIFPTARHPIPAVSRLRLADAPLQSAPSTPPAFLSPDHLFI